MTTGATEKTTHREPTDSELDLFIPRVLGAGTGAPVTVGEMREALAGMGFDVTRREPARESATG